MKKFKNIFFVFLIGIFFIGCKKSDPHSYWKNFELENEIQITSEKEKMNANKINDPFEIIDSSQMPSAVPMSNEQMQYVIEVIQVLFRIIDGKSNFEAEAHVLGKGKYFWPKNPKEKIEKIITFDDDLKIAGLTVGFTRKDQTSAWSKAILSIIPKNFPRGVYLMDLPDNFFSNFNLDKAHTENRPNQSVATVNIFEFTNKNNSKIKLKIEAGINVSNIESKTVKNFHHFSVLLED